MLLRKGKQDLKSAREKYVFNSMLTKPKVYSHLPNLRGNTKMPKKISIARGGKPQTDLPYNNFFKSLKTNSAILKLFYCYGQPT